MCLNVLRCMGVTTVEKGDSDVEETTRRQAPVEEAAKIYPNGNGQRYPPKSTTADTAHHPSQQHHEEDAATRKGQIKTMRAATSDSGERPPANAKQEWEYHSAGTNNTKGSPADRFNVVAGQPRRGGYDEGLPRATVPADAATYAGQYKTAHGGDAYVNSRAATSDSGERSPVRAKQEKSPSEYYSAGTNKTKESPADQFPVVAGQPRRGGYDEGLHGATVPADAATYAGEYKTAHGRDAYGNSTYADEASIKSVRTSEEQGTARRGQLKTSEVDDGRSRRGSSEASVASWLWQ